MKTVCLLLILAAPSLVRADVVLDWNEMALGTIRRTSTSPPEATRTLAMMHVAIYDAVNSIDHTHQSFRVYAPDKSETSREAAAAQAAFRVLLHLYPAERPHLDRAFAASLARVQDEPGKLAGVRLGDIVAGRIIAWRHDDGSQRRASHPSGTRPGQWRPTPPDFKPALLPQWRYVEPFALPSASQFRAPLPPDLTSVEYARHLQEVETLGAVHSAVRTKLQTDTAYYWADGAATATPPGHWNRIAQSVANSERLPLQENARLFALLNVALADAAIVCWDMKYTYNLWRPITAIHEADSDGNVETNRYSSWQPLLETPPFPSCASGHSTFSGAAAQILALFFGRDEVRFSDTSETSRASRTYASFPKRPRKQAGAASMGASISSSTTQPDSKVAVPWLNISSTATSSRSGRPPTTAWRPARLFVVRPMKAVRSAVPQPLPVTIERTATSRTRTPPHSRTQAAALVLSPATVFQPRPTSRQQQSMC